MKIEPRMFMPSVSDHQEEDEYSDDSINLVPNQLSSTLKKESRFGNGRMIEDTRLQTENRQSLRRFETLKVRGRELTGLSIGGFEVDLNVAAQKAMEILPMPASKLPVIFLDEELNFLHHFFQGVTKLIGESNMQAISDKRKYYEDEHPVVLGMIEDLILEGYDKSDSEIVTFLKKVISSTFELTTKNRRSKGLETVRVSANLWGFQYIECGMLMEESDLQMWLSMCYGQYRTSWFNTFKSSGVPLFAHEGSGKTRSYSSMSSGSYSDHKLEPVIESDTMSIKSHKSRSSKRHSSKSRGPVNNRRQNTENSLLKYLSG
jgi:hypothetical protein